MTSPCPHCGSMPRASSRKLGLTAMQRECLAAIKSVIDSGKSPSFDDLCAATRLQSKSSIHRLVTALEERGYILRLPNLARSISIVGDA